MTKVAKQPKAKKVKKAKAKPLIEIVEKTTKEFKLGAVRPSPVNVFASGPNDITYYTGWMDNSDYMALKVNCTTGLIHRKELKKAIEDGLVYKGIKVVLPNTTDVEICLKDEPSETFADHHNLAYRLHCDYVEGSEEGGQEFLETQDEFIENGYLMIEPDKNEPIFTLCSADGGQIGYVKITKKYLTALAKIL